MYLPVHYIRYTEQLAQATFVLERTSNSHRLRNPLPKVLLSIPLGRVQVISYYRYILLILYL
jgi:hypothetical protein